MHALMLSMLPVPLPHSFLCYTHFAHSLLTPWGLGRNTNGKPVIAFVDNTEKFII